MQDSEQKFGLPFEQKDKAVYFRMPNEPTDKKFGKRPEERTVQELLQSSIINIDKPSGPTSHQVSAYVRDILHVSKAGHSGTLDPKVTGVQPIAIGTGTRVTQSLLTAGKEYITVMHIHKEVALDRIKAALEKFIGTIKQLPPQKSAVKRQVRERNVYYIELLDVDGQDVLFKVGCQAGTYIRKLCHDMGLLLGTGAHMASLRRTRAGPFTEENLCTLQDLKDAYHYYVVEKDDKPLMKLLQPIEKAVEHLPKIWVLDSTVDNLCHGAQLKVPGVVKYNSSIQNNDLVAVMTLKDELIGVGRAVLSGSDLKKAEHGLAVMWEQVFMSPGIYPRIERLPEKHK
ncbi:MAG: RNA-guided pseudouridylation complex pseudouridine synthase subunit Cbf5 [archaeon]